MALEEEPVLVVMGMVKGMVEEVDEDIEGALILRAFTGLQVPV